MNYLMVTVYKIWTWNNESRLVKKMESLVQDRQMVVFDYKNMLILGEC